MALPTQPGKIDLHFVNFTNPEIESKSKANRKRVRTLVKVNTLKRQKTAQASSPKEDREDKKETPPPRTASRESSTSDVDVVEPQPQTKVVEQAQNDHNSDEARVAQRKQVPPKQALMRVWKPSAKGFQTSPLLTDTPSTGVLDPFSTFDVQPVPDDLKVSDFYLRAFSAPDSIHHKMFSHDKAYEVLIPMALAYEPLYHAVIFAAHARSTALLQKGPMVEKCLMQGQRTIHSIRKALTQMKNEPSDELIMATGLLGGGEMCFTFQESQAKAHLKGLVDMLKARGGPQNMKNEVARNMILWMISLKQPESQPVGKVLAETEDSERLSDFSSVQDDDEVGQWCGITLSATLASALRALQQIIEDLPSPTVNTRYLPPSRQEILIDGLDTIQFRLLGHLSSSVPSSPYSETSTLSSSNSTTPSTTTLHQNERDNLISLAALVLTHQLLNHLAVLPPKPRRMPQIHPPLGTSPSAISCQAYASSIRHQLLHATDRRFMADSMPLLLWVLYVAGSSTNHLGPDDEDGLRAWFIQSAKVMAGHAAGEWATIQGLLRNFMYVDALDAQYKGFWSECRRESVI